MSNYFSGTHHQLVASLTPQRLYVVNLRRGALGWRRVRVADITLAEGTDSLQQIEFELKKCLEPWNLPQGTRVQWVLAGDILGIVTPAKGETFESSIPFAKADLHTQPDQYPKTELQSFLWIHNDWLAEIERISSACKLELVELFSRAQLYQRDITIEKDAVFTAVIEEEAATVFLHIFGLDGGILRSSVLNTTSVSESQSLIEAEFAAISDILGAKGRAIKILIAGGAASLSGWESYHVSTLPDVTLADRLERLVHSRLEGITVRSYDAVLLKSLKISSALLAIIGLMVLSAISWLDTNLEKSLVVSRAQARKDAPKVLEAKNLSRKSRAMEDVVQTVEKFRITNTAFDAFHELLANFPPAPAALLYVRIEPNSIAFSGTDTPASHDWFNDKTLSGYQRVTVVTPPDFLQNVQPTFSFQAIKESNLKTPSNPPAVSSSGPTGAKEKL